jgi:uncharacterized damage-inducible protein DinB
MTVKDLEDLYDYGYWADRKLFDVISQLTPEEFTRSVAGSYESVRNTMVHILSAEAGWLDRCGGPARGPSLNPVDFPTIESVTQAWNRLGELMQHAAIHGVHHRGQVAMLLRLLGRAPGNFDILVYYAVKGAASAK